MAAHIGTLENKLQKETNSPQPTAHSPGQAKQSQKAKDNTNKEKPHRKSNNFNDRRDQIRDQPILISLIHFLASVSMVEK